MGASTNSSSELSSRRINEYATADDFCLIFSRNMDGLYTLALLLTADPAKAEQCFLSAVDECRKASVFKPWAESWSRLAVIESAIRIVRPSPSVAAEVTETAEVIADGVHPTGVPVLHVRAFDRFVLVLSVLDRYSIRDCAILLKWGAQEIQRAKQRAIGFIGSAGERFRSTSNSAA